MFALLYIPADSPFPNRYQKTVGLGELCIVQAIKHIVNPNLKRTARLARLTHAFSEHSETQPKLG